jgi:hypothetical protein
VNENIDETTPTEVIILNTEDASQNSLEQAGKFSEDSDQSTNVNENIDETTPTEAIILNTEDASQNSLKQNGEFSKDRDHSADVNEVEISISHVNENIDETTPTEVIILNTEDANQKSLEQAGEIA